MNIENVIKGLEANNMKAFFVESKEEVVPLIKTLVKKGESVSCGGSVTLKECGVDSGIFQSGDYEFIDRSGLEGEELRAAYIRTFACDTFFTSVNAITESGELYNVDGNSNRVACIVYGPRQVIAVVGINKIVKNLDEAVMRVKTIAAPKNTTRLNCKTPCANTGKCISLENSDSQMCDGCRSDARICCSYVVSAKQRHKDRIKVIIVNEELGY